MTRELFMTIALSFLNRPYKWGGDDPTGIDCSGLVQELLMVLGIDPPGDQTAHALYLHFKKDGAEGVLDTGSLCFYGREDRITHVSMMLEYPIVIEAGGGGSKTHTLDDAVKQNAFVRCRPYNARKDFVAIIQPKGLLFRA